jgi:hypothetical protein
MPGHQHRTATVKEYGWPWGPRNRMKTPGCVHRTATVMERTFLPAPSMEGIHQSIGHFNRVNHDTTRRELQ